MSSPHIIIRFRVWANVNPNLISPSRKEKLFMDSYYFQKTALFVRIPPFLPALEIVSPPSFLHYINNLKRLQNPQNAVALAQEEVEQSSTNQKVGGSIPDMK